MELLACEQVTSFFLFIDYTTDSQALENYRPSYVRVRQLSTLTKQ